MKNIETITVRIFCPNCGSKILGEKSDDGSMKIQCHTCKAVIFSKRRDKKEINVRVITRNT